MHLCFVLFFILSVRYFFKFSAVSNTVNLEYICHHIKVYCSLFFYCTHRGLCHYKTDHNFVQGSFIYVFSDIRFQFLILNNINNFIYFYCLFLHYVWVKFVIYSSLHVGFFSHLLFSISNRYCFMQKLSSVTEYFLKCR